MAEQRTYPFLPDDKCLTEQQLFDYIDGKLLVSEMHLVEKHLLDCAMCSDALEGLENVKHRGKVAAFSPGNNSEKPEEEEKPKVIPLWSNKRTIYSIAAAIVLLLCITVVMRMNLGDNNNEASKKLADNAIVKSDSQNSQHVQDQNRFIPDTAPVAVSNDAMSNNPKGSPQKSASPKADVDSKTPTDYRNNTTTQSDMETSKAVGSVDVPATINHADEASGKMAEEDKVVVAFDDNNKDGDFNAVEKDQSNSSGSNGAKTTGDVPTSNAERGGVVDSKKEGDRKNDYFKTKDSAQPTNAPASQPVVNQNAGAGPGGYTAVSDSSTTLASGSQNEKASSSGAAHTESVNDEETEAQVNLSYQNGVKMLDAGKAQESLAYFDDVLNYPANANFQDAQWKKAQALIQLKRTDEAKVLLNDIVKKNGKYANDAKTKLKTL
jgi:hypothetical protein